MKILYITHYCFPHVGGVEKHVYEVSRLLKLRGHKIKIISEKDITFPKIKLVGLIYIWHWFFKNRHLIRECDIVHIHDVFIWYLPFRFFYPYKKVITTIHGWSGKIPIPLYQKLLNKIACRLSFKTISVGEYVSKYFGIKPDYVIYGGVNTIKTFQDRKEKLIVFLGRLEKDTGVFEFIKRIEKYKNYKIVFIGDGSLSKLCGKYGKVLGFTDPSKYLSKASICFAGGYLSALEALNNKCILWTGYDNPLKKDYWSCFPYNIKSKLPSWKSVSNLYESIYLHNS